MTNVTSKPGKNAPLTREKPSPGFEVVRINPSSLGVPSSLGINADPLLQIDHFRMSAPTFAPHPHAGFSAITYLLPESIAGIANRDSWGDKSHIPPGGLHWTAAGSGIVHEEIPEPANHTTEGFQIFIKQPQAQETTPPVIHHIEPRDIPVMALANGGFLRVITGTHENLAAPFTPPSPVALLDLKLAPEESFDWPLPWPDGSAMIYVFRGTAAIDGQAIKAPSVYFPTKAALSVAIKASGQEMRALLFAGESLGLPIYRHGPFAMSSAAATQAAIRRYQRGEMGRL